MNRYQKIVRSRIEALILESEAAGEVKHNATSGHLREKYLTRFLKQMTPDGIHLTSGALLDLTDKLSPQIDLIAVVPGMLPSIDLHDEVSIVPVEAALWAIEVKTQILPKDLGQLERQNRWIEAAVTILSNIIIPTALVAWRGGLSRAAIRDWMQTPAGKNTALCCVIGEFYLLRDSDTIREFDADQDYREVMYFLSDYWGALKLLGNRRKMQMQFDERSPPRPHPLEAYLKNLAQYGTISPR